MKFSIAAVFAAIGFADARISTVEKKKLLRKAVPVNKDGSRRQLNGEYEVSAYDVISFTDCLSLTWQNEDALDENLWQSTADGSIIPQTSYAVFRVINTQNSYSMQGESDLWMLKLDDWVEATANTDAEEKENYCEACEMSYDVCYPEEEEAEEDDAAEDDAEEDDAEEGGDDRKRKYKKRALTAKTIAHRESLSAIMDSRKLQNGQYQQYVNCYTCEARGCFEEDEEDDNDYNNYCDQDAYVYGCTFEEEAVEQFMGEAACSETGIVEYYNGAEYEVRAGLMCNDDGSGVEMAMFADEECSLYHAGKSFSEDMEGTYLYGILGEAASSIMKPYINSISCMGIEYLELADEDEEDDGNNDEDEGPEVSETCQNIMDEASDIGTCGGEEREYQDYQEEQEDDDGQAYPDIWYSYDFTDGEEPDEKDVCFALQDLNGMYNSKHVFKKDTSGNFFDYRAAKNGGSSSGAGKIFGIFVAVAVVVVAGVLIMQNMNSKRDTKKVPLVGNQAGAMA